MMRNYRENYKQKIRPENKRTALLAFFIFFSLFMPARSSGEAVIAGSIEIHGLYSIDRDEFLDLLGLGPGVAVDQDRIRIGIKRAFLKGIFEDISVEVSEGAAHDIMVHVREKEFISKIYIEGDYQVSKKKIEELFLLKKDQVMRYDLVQQAKEDLKGKLLFYGFPEARIDMKVDKTAQPFRVNIHLTIDTGPPLVIRTIQIVGTDLELKDMLKISPGDVYDRHRMNNEIKRAVERLKKQGYYQPSVGIDYYREGDLEITVKPGKKLFVDMEGNRVISTKDLMKQAPFFEMEIFNDEVISEAVDRMLFLYHEKGYAAAQIAPVTSSDENAIHITFFIFEGERFRVKNVKFPGAELPHERLEAVMNLRKDGLYNPDVLEKDRDSLKEIYGALGYLEVEVREFETKTDEKEKTVEITVNIHEGERTVISDIEISGVGPDMKEKLMHVIGIKRGDPYNEIDISDARFRVLDYYSNYGYAVMDVDVMRNIEGHKASLKFSVLEGTKKFFGKTIITGNKQTRYEVIKRELTHKEDGPYNFRTLTNDRQRLYKLGLFTEVDMESLNRGEDKQDLLIKVKEGNAGAVEFGFGYAEYEKYRGFMDLSYRNFFGMNRQGLLRTEISSLERRFVLQYHDPWFMRYPLPFRAFFLSEQKKEINISDNETRYKLEKYTFSAGIEKKIAATVKADIYYEFSLVRTSDIQPDVILSREDEGTLAISSIKPSIIYDTRDNPFDPAEGMLAGISLKLASPVLLSESNFTKFILNSSIYHKLHRRVILAVSVKGGSAFGFGKTNELPIVERFFLGGRSTVRGYEQDTLGPKGVDGNPTGGNAFLMGNIELRALIGRGFSLVPFFDLGNVWIKAKDMNPGDLKYTTGIGLRYNTPVGPLRIDYGIKLQTEPGESRSALHFSIGHAF